MWGGFEDFWNVPREFRHFVNYSEDQAPITGCVCCPSNEALVFASKSGRYSRKSKQLRVDGIGVSEVISSQLQRQYQRRSWNFLDDKLRRLSLWDRKAPGHHHDLPYFLAAPYTPPSPAVEKALIKSPEILAVLREDPLSYFGIPLEDVPIPVRITGKAAKDSVPALPFQDWQQAYEGRVLPVPMNLRGRDFVVRAEDLRRGFAALKHWLAFGRRPPSEAEQNMAGVCAMWLYPKIYNGARTGKTKIVYLKNHFHHPCRKHRKFVNEIFS